MRFRRSTDDAVSAIKRNIASMLLSQGATWILSILVLVVVPGELGDELFGELSFALVYVSLFGLLATYGTSEFLTKTLARDLESTGHYVFNTLVMKLIVSLAASALAIGLGLAIGFDGQRIALIIVNCIGMVLSVLNNVLLGGLQALQRMGRPALWNSVGLYVGGISGVTLLFNGAGVVTYMLAVNAAGIIPLIGNSVALRTELRTRAGIDPSVWKHVLIGGFPFFAMSGLLAVYGSVDIPMIAAFAGSQTVGWYALAYRWVSMPAFFAAVVATAHFPRGRRAALESSNEFASMANRAIYMVLLVAIPGAVGIALIADDFISTLYGPNSGQAVPIMQLLALHIPIVGLDIVLGTTVVAADRQRQWLLFSGLAAVFNPLANLAAIPLAMEWFDNGAIGAAFTTVLTEMILMIGGLIIRPKGVLDRATRNVVVRIASASAAMIPVILLLGSNPLYVQIPSGVVVFGAACVALKVMTIQELRDLRAGLTRGGRPSDQEVAVGH